MNLAVIFHKEGILICSQPNLRAASHGLASANQSLPSKNSLLALDNCLKLSYFSGFSNTFEKMNNKWDVKFSRVYEVYFFLCIFN